MAQFRTFAVGEVLTAQDANDYLVNETRMETFNDPAEIFSDLASGVSILTAEAIRVVNAAGRGWATVRFTADGVDVTSGGITVEIGQLAPPLHNTGWFGFDGYFSSGALQGACSTAGALYVRWASSSTTARTFFGTGAYPIGF